MPGETSCTTAEKKRVSVSYITGTGKPAVVDGDTQVTVLSGDGMVSRVDSAGNPVGPHEFYVISGTVPGDTVYEVSADADLGTGIRTIIDIYTLHATSEEAAAFGFSTGPAEPK